MGKFIYGFYILPLRVFFCRLKPRNAVSEDVFFLYYFGGVGFGPVLLLCPFLDKRLNELWYLISIASAIILVMAIGTHLAKYYLARYELSDEQIHSRKLLLLGGVIYFEWIAFLFASAFYIVPGPWHNWHI